MKLFMRILKTATTVLSPVALMTALEEAVIGFAAEETVLTLEAAALSRFSDHYQEMTE